MTDTFSSPQPDERRFARERLEILEAFVAAVDRRDEVLQIVGDAATTDEARSQVSAVLNLNEVQATAVLDLQIRRFSVEQRQRLLDEREEIRRRSQ